MEHHPIGVFDSGYGGLTILKEIKKRLPDYDFVYLGDNARNPYGTRSFDIVYQYTLQAVKTLFSMGCNLVILACNTASAKALRTIQQKDLPLIDPEKRVLGVIRPTIERVAEITLSRHVGLLATEGTVASHSYKLELEKISPDIKITEHACPMWVPLVENNETQSQGADFFVNKDIKTLLVKDPLIDTILLGCTHYPLLLDNIHKFVDKDIKIVSQGNIVARSLEDYLFRHPEMERKCTKNGLRKYYTTENPDKFNSLGSIFMEKDITASHIDLN